MKRHATILLYELFNDRRNDGGGNRISRSDSQFTCGWIGEVLDVLYALPQFIEYHSASFNKGMAVGRWLNASPGAINQAHAQRMLEVGDRLRDRRLRHVEM